MNTVSASTLAATLAAAQNEPWTEDAICPQIDTDLAHGDLKGPMPTRASQP
jgi:hypothetical protein